MRSVGIDLIGDDRDPWESETPARSQAPSPTDELAPDSPVTLYLQEINRRPLLSAAEEVELAQRREAGQAAKIRLAGGEYRLHEREELDHAVSVGEAASTL